MSRITLVDLELEHARARSAFIRNLETHLARILEICSDRDPECKLIIFGSYVKGTMRPDSDIDILLITETARNPLERGRLRAEISRKIGIDTPLEIHIVTREEYEGWYRKFIDAHIDYNPPRES